VAMVQRVYLLIST